MRRVPVAILIALVALVAVAGPVSAGDVIKKESNTDGGYGTGVYASVVVGGHVGVPVNYPQCNWEKVWDLSFWERLIDGIQAIAARVLGRPPANFDEAKLVLNIDDPDSNLFADGRFAELLNRDPSTVVSYEGSDVSFLHQLVIYITGSERVGRFKPIADASDELDDDPSYPQILRGTYRTPSGDEEELWWDPYYVTADNPGPDGPDLCPPGVFYSPRNSDPVALIPDLQDYIARNLPTIEPDLNPLDQFDDWAYVNVPLNFTAPPASLTPVQATAYVQDVGGGGSVWAQATATPNKMIFLPGDGTTVVCDIADSELAYDPAVPGFCSHTYLDSSNTYPGGVYEAALGITWVGEFNDSNGVLRTFPVPPSWTTFDLAVAEARAAVALP